jgi:ArsR family transcriptional regulator, arsenate/arsenite/antimonite-responsive transcriptional repressor
MNEAAHNLFRALSDPIRLRILHLLKSGELCVGDLVSVLRVPQPTASRHLAYLRRLGLLTSRKKSYWTYYTLAPAKTTLRRRLYQCLDADGGDRSGDMRRLKAVKKDGGCCPV